MVSFLSDPYAHLKLAVFSYSKRMSAAAHYKFNTEGRPAIPGALWADGHPGPAPNVPLPGLVAGKPAYMPLDVHLRRTYESDDHGWQEVKARRSNKAGWRGAKKNKTRSQPKMTLDQLISSLGGKSYLVV